jgi:chromosome segregation ATPase
MVKSTKTQKKSVIKKDEVIEEGINNKLIENFVSLQRIMTNLAVKLEDLSSQISKLLELFEISAKAIADKDFSLGDNNKINNQLSEKLDNLLEQNKIIAKGITLLHEKESQQNVPFSNQSFSNQYSSPYSQSTNIYPQANSPYKPKTISADTLGKQSLNQKFVRPLE